MKRTFYRFTADDIPLKIIDPDSDESSYADVLDMSGNGISFTTTRAIPFIMNEGDPVYLNFFLGEDHYQLSAIVRRIKQFTPFQIFYACEFTGLNPKIRASLIGSLFGVQRKKESDEHE